MSHVIVPLDGSTLAERALPFAATLARLTESTLKLVESAIDPAALDAGLAVDTLLDLTQEYLDQQAAAVTQRNGVAVSTHATVASAVGLILDEAGRPGAAAVVMSTHGRSGLGRLIMGSVAEGVLRDAAVPVYLVPAVAEGVSGSLRHVLVPLDGSALSYSVLGPVTQVAREAQARITLLRVFGSEEGLDSSADADAIRAVEKQLDRLEDKAHDYFGPIKAHLRASGLKVDTEWSTGSAAQEILATAELRRADLIALATHGRSGLDRVRYGSITESVLRHAKVPLMTFGPQALRRLARDVGPLTDRRMPEGVGA